MARSDGYMDILYIVGGGSRHDNVELRWSLRSVEKYGANVGRIIVAGIIPEWLSDEVVTIPVEQKSPLYAKNNWENVMAAIGVGAVRGRFLLSADDHFYVREVDFDNFPLFVSGFLPKELEFRNNNEYFYGLYYSRKILEKEGLPIYNCSLHNNIVVDADMLAAHPAVVDACNSPHHRMNPWAVLGNVALANDPEAKVITRSDIKINEKMDNVIELSGRIGNAPMFSIGDAAFEGGALETYMNRMFAKKSRYEI